MDEYAIDKNKTENTAQTNQEPQVGIRDLPTLIYRFDMPEDEVKFDEMVNMGVDCYRLYTWAKEAHKECLEAPDKQKREARAKEKEAIGKFMAAFYKYFYDKYTFTYNKEENIIKQLREVNLYSLTVNDREFTSLLIVALRNRGVALDEMVDFYVGGVRKLQSPFPEYENFFEEDDYER